MMAMICDVISKVGLTLRSSIDFHSAKWFLAGALTLRWWSWAGLPYEHRQGGATWKGILLQGNFSHNRCKVTVDSALISGLCVETLQVISGDCSCWSFWTSVARIMVSNYLTAQEIGECLQNPSKHQAVFCFDTLQRVCATVQPVFAYLTLYEVFWKPWHAVAVLNHGKTTGKW